MTSPVRIEIELADISNLIEKAQECAEDLIAEVDAKYPDNDPVSVRRRHRDSEVGRWLVSAISAYRIKYPLD